jgi:hypothetical protein
MSQSFSLAKCPRSFPKKHRVQAAGKSLFGLPQNIKLVTSEVVWELSNGNEINDVALPSFLKSLFAFPHGSSLVSGTKMSQTELQAGKAVTKELLAAAASFSG